jgi:serine O-acetyltransferase
MVAERPRQTWRETRRLLALDIQLYGAWPISYGQWPAGRPRWMLFVYLLVTVHSFAPVVVYRLQTFLYDAGRRGCAGFLSRLNSVVYGVTIGHHVRTTGGLFIAHGPIVLDGWTTLGHNVQLNPFVTLGVTNSSRRGFDLRGPTVGDHVSIGTGAKVLGPVTVGAYVKIGANAVVVGDVPERHTAVGAPARSFPTAEQEGGEPDWEREELRGLRGEASKF